VQRARGDYDAARRTLDGLAFPWDRQSTPALALPLEVYRAVLQAETGSRAQAAAWLGRSAFSSGLSAGTEPNLANEMALLDLARLLMLLERLAPAQQLLGEIMRAADAGGRQRAAIHARVLLAKTAAAQGNLDQAAEVLEQALRLAQAEGYLRVFLDEGETTHRLLGALRAKLGQGDALAGYLRRILAAFEPATEAVEAAKAGKTTGASAPQASGQEWFDPLSERESEILRLAAQGLTNQAIADRLVISLTTVKTHVGNIFLKLGVKNRTQAIARAETLGLLPRR